MKKSICKMCVNKHMYQKWDWVDEWRWYFRSEARCKAWYQFGNDDRVISGEMPRHCFYPVEQIVSCQNKLFLLAKTTWRAMIRVLELNRKKS